MNLKNKLINFALEVLKQELESVRNRHKETKQKLKEFKEKYNGK